MANPENCNLMHQQSELLDEIIEKVVTIAEPNKLYLVSALSTVLQRAFCDAHSSDMFESVTHYNLLVVSSKNNGKHELQDIIENTCKSLTPVTALVLSPLNFNNLLSDEELFSKSALKQARLLYEAQNSVPLDVLQNINQKGVPFPPDDAYNCARGFLASAELHKLRNELKLCAFMLHQAVEQFCLGNILIHLGVNPKTHNLDKLYRLFRFFSFELTRAFPRDNEREEKLFQAIKTSYTEARYSSNPTIRSKDIVILIRRVSELLDAQCLSRVYDNQAF